MDAIAVRWWVVAAASEGHGRFTNGVVLNDQLLWYFGRDGWNWRVITEPFAHSVTVLLPWGPLLPFAVRRAFHEADPNTVRRVRPLLVWLATVVAIMAVSGNQRERSYLMAVGYWMVDAVAVAFGRADLLQPVLAAWTASIIFAGVGTVLLLKART